MTAHTPPTISTSAAWSALLRHHERDELVKPTLEALKWLLVNYRASMCDPDALDECADDLEGAIAALIEDAHGLAANMREPLCCDE